MPFSLHSAPEIGALLEIVERGKGETIEIADVLALPPGPHWRQADLRQRAEAKMTPYREAGLVLRHCIPGDPPEVFYTLTRAGLAFAARGATLHQWGDAE